VPRLNKTIVILAFVFSFLAFPFKALAMDGTGTQNDPYQITNIQEFNDIRNKLNSSYVLLNDIDASETKTWNANGDGTYKGFLPVGDSVNKPSVKLDGKGFIIKNLYMNTNNENAGLFQYANGVTIENLGLLNLDITGTKNVAPFISYADSGNNVIKKSFSTGKIKATIGQAGGLAGELGGTGSYLIRNAYSLANIESNSTAGGLVHTARNITIENSYFGGTMKADGVYGIAKDIYTPATFSNNYFNKEVLKTTSDLTSTGLNAGTGLTLETIKQRASYLNWDFINVWKIDTQCNQGMPLLQEFHATASPTQLYSDTFSIEASKTPDISLGFLNPKKGSEYIGFDSKNINVEFYAQDLTNGQVSANTYNLEYALEGTEEWKSIANNLAPGISLTTNKTADGKNTLVYAWNAYTNPGAGNYKLRVSGKNQYGESAYVTSESFKIWASKVYQKELISDSFSIIEALPANATMLMIYILKLSSKL